MNTASLEYKSIDMHYLLTLWYKIYSLLTIHNFLQFFLAFNQIILEAENNAFFDIFLQPKNNVIHNIQLMLFAENVTVSASVLNNKSHTAHVQVATKQNVITILPTACVIFTSLKWETCLRKVFSGCYSCTFTVHNLKSGQFEI